MGPPLRFGYAFGTVVPVGIQHIQHVHSAWYIVDTGHPSIWVGRPLGDEEPHPDWLVFYRVAPQDGEPVIAEIRILPRPRADEELPWLQEELADGEKPRSRTKGGSVPAIPAGGLSARAVRAGVRTGEALELAREALNSKFEHDRQHPETAVDDTTWLGFTPEMLASPRRPGRKGRSDRFYAEIAAAYVEAVAAKSPHAVRDVTKRLAGEQNKHYSESSVRALIHQARKRELLTRPPRGQAGGHLTDKALALLTEEAD